MLKRLSRFLERKENERVINLYSMASSLAFFLLALASVILYLIILN